LVAFTYLGIEIYDVIFKDFPNIFSINELEATFSCDFDVIFTSNLL